MFNFSFEQLRGVCISNEISLPLIFWHALNEKGTVCFGIFDDDFRRKRKSAIGKAPKGAGELGKGQEFSANR